MNWKAKKFMPTPSDVHIDAALNNLSLAFMQSAENFVAGRVFPNVPVDKQSDKYFTFDRSYWFRDEMKKRGDGTESHGAGFSISNDSYSADVWSLHKDLGRQTLGNADAGLDLDNAAVSFLATQKMIRQEKQFATDFFASSKWTTDYTPGTLWSDGASDPIGDVETAKETVLKSTGMMPNKLVLGYPVWKALRQHPDLVARVDRGQTSGNARVSLETAAAIFEVDEVLVTKAIENTANEGATASYDFIGGKHALVCHTPSAPGLLVPAAGYTFSWTGMPGATVLGTTVKRWWSDDRSAWRYEIDAAFDMKIVSADLGYFFASVVA